MLEDWIKITCKFSNKCILCGETINQGETILWKKGSGIRHINQCIDESTEDKSQFIITEFDDYNEYSYIDLEKIKKCQICGKKLDKKDVFIYGNRKICEDCFG